MAYRHQQRKGHFRWTAYTVSEVIVYLTSEFHLVSCDDVPRCGDRFVQKYATLCLGTTRTPYFRRERERMGTRQPGPSSARVRSSSQPYSSDTPIMVSVVGASEKERSNFPTLDARSGHRDNAPDIL
jgi:hypothetical protein